MNADSKTCPDCGALIPADAPQGLCPKCLMAGAASPTEAGTASDARPRRPAPPVEEIAAAFPHLQVLGLIGQGGMGFVYRARQPRLERDVALKILPRHLAEDPKFAERFAREGKLLAKLSHPNIVSIFDFGESGGFFYLLMEFVDGVNLRQAMRASRFTAAQALAIVPRICEALQFAHDEGVLHRDIKPENILLDGKGRVKIADFGIAKLMEQGGPSPGKTGGKPILESATKFPANETAAGSGAATRELTAVSSILGTPQYMAPEQKEHPSEVDHRADIYSLGVVFYELLTGELPVGKFAPPSTKTPLNERVDEIVLRALAKEREFRQQSATELKTQVEELTPHVQPVADPVSRPNPWPHWLFWSIAGPLMLAVAATIAALLRPMLQNANAPNASLFAGCLPIVAGALMVTLFLKTRPLSGASPAAWNPWPKRIFWMVVALVIVPATLLLIGLLVPSFSWRAARAEKERQRAVAAAAYVEARLNKVIVRVESGAGEPLAEARVTISGLPEPYQLLSVVTDSHGRAELRLPAETVPAAGMVTSVHIQVFKNGYSEADPARATRRYFVAGERPADQGDWSEPGRLSIPGEPLELRVAMDRAQP